MMKDKLEALRTSFEAGVLDTAEKRIAVLKKFKTVIQKHEIEILEALHTDLGKSPEEAFVSENGFVLGELDDTVSNLQKWMKPKKVKTNFINFPGSSSIHHEPLGVVLIIAPWNYPVNLLFTPLIGAIAAGNTVVLKPSEFAPAIAAVMDKIVAESFAKDVVLYVQGSGETVIPEMLDVFRFNHIFYTGSTAVGKKIYEAAAKQLTPVTLELGGKSPCVVDADADISVAAKRISFGKFLNAGQTCVAPDYILVHESVREKFVDELIKFTSSFYKDAAYDLGKIINRQQYDRLKKYIDAGDVVYGGEFDDATLKIMPTILHHTSLTDKIMQEEIFGPILPVFAFSTMQEAKNIIKENPDPLAFYIFTKNRNNADAWLKAIPSGGACVNNASVHLSNKQLPFGGRGNSGIGNYHGQSSFTNFSHAKSVLHSRTWLDPLIKYPPYKGKLGLLKKFMG